METHGSDSGASALVRALEDAYAAIRSRHDEVPPVWIVVSDGQGRGGERRAGHFAAWRWATVNGEARHELMVASQRLADGPALVFETLLHEAAHALCAARGVKDTSRNGRYHNDRYKGAAEELGLAVEKSEHGWNATALADGTADRYAEVIEALGLAIDSYTGWRDSAAPKARQSQIKGWCTCGRVIRASATVWEEAAILCGECGDTFAADYAALREWREVQITKHRHDGSIVDHLRGGGGEDEPVVRPVHRDGCSCEPGTLWCLDEGDEEAVPF